MGKNDLKQRWGDESMSTLRGRIRAAIYEKRKLEDVEGILYINGKADLRGLPFQAQANIDLSGSLLENADLSQCDLSNMTIERATFKACLFENANFSGTTLAGVEIIDSTFLKSTLKNGRTKNSSEKKDDGFMKGVTFTECDLSKYEFSPIIADKCLFEHCRFSETFINARLSNTQFIGKIEDSWFRGFPWRGTEKLSLLDKLFSPKRDPKKRNRMVNVDLSKAQLHGVFFSDGIDLSTTIFPQQDDYFRVDNFSQVFKKVKEKITSEWESPYKERALLALDRHFFDGHKTDMEIDFIYTGFEFTGLAPDFKKRFFDLIKEINNT